MFGKFWALVYARRYLRISTRRFELLIGVVEKLFTSRKYRIGIINQKTFLKFLAKILMLILSYIYCNIEYNDNGKSKLRFH